MRSRRSCVLGVDGSARSRSTRPSIPWSGVRSSWLTLARKRTFSLVAACASSVFRESSAIVLRADASHTAPMVGTTMSNATTRVSTSTIVTGVSAAGAASCAMTTTPTKAAIASTIAQRRPLPPPPMKRQMSGVNASHINADRSLLKSRLAK